MARRIGAARVCESRRVGDGACDRRIAALLLLACCATFAPAAMGQQVPPFFAGGVVAYDPQVAVIESGVLLDVQPTVSADRKYVTMNVRATNSNLRSLQPFAVSTVGQGFVGGSNVAPRVAAGAAAPAAGGAANAPRQESPVAIDRAAPSWLLTRQGMYLIKPLN